MKPEGLQVHSRRGCRARSIALATMAGRAGGHTAQVPAEGQGREAAGLWLHRLCLAEKRWKDREDPGERPSGGGPERGRSRPLGPTPKVGPAHPWDLIRRAPAGDSTPETSPGTDRAGELHCALWVKGSAEAWGKTGGQAVGGVRRWEKPASMLCFVESWKSPVALG